MVHFAPAAVTAAMSACYYPRNASQPGRPEKISTDKSWDNYCINSPFVALTATASYETIRFLKVSLHINSCCDTLIDVKKKKFGTSLAILSKLKIGMLVSP